MPDPSRLRSPTQEIALVDQIERLDNYRRGRWAVHLFLSRLSPANRKESFIRIATETFAGAVLGLDGQLFALHNDDVVFVARDVTLTLLHAALDRVRALFPNDPLFEREPVRGQDKGSYCCIYNLELDYDAALLDAREMLARADQSRLAAAQSKEQIPTPLSPETLARIEQLIMNLDVAAVLRRQTVCTLIEDRPPEAIFDETYVSIEDLQTLVTRGIDLAANTWLFHYLTTKLDQRVMLCLMRDGTGASTRPFSVNLNIASVLSPTFPKFEAAVTPHLRGRLVVEMNAIDVFSDMNNFIFARDYLRDHGFRVCLDGLTHHTLPYYDREKLGFDLIKIHWTPDSLDTLQDGHLPQLRAIVRETGVAHTILCRCEDSAALSLGRELGIVMFQGRQVDKLLKAPATAAPRF